MWVISGVQPSPVRAEHESDDQRSVISPRLGLLQFSLPLFQTGSNSRFTRNQSQTLSLTHTVIWGRYATVIKLIIWIILIISPHIFWGEHLPVNLVGSCVLACDWCFCIIQKTTHTPRWLSDMHHFLHDYDLSNRMLHEPNNWSLGVVLINR